MDRKGIAMALALATVVGARPVARPLIINGMPLSKEDGRLSSEEDEVGRLSSEEDEDDEEADDKEVDENDDGGGEAAEKESETEKDG